MRFSGSLHFSNSDTGSYFADVYVGCGLCLGLCLGLGLGINIKNDKETFFVVILVI